VAAEAQAVTEQPTRRFWQLHLSTALVGTLITGSLLGLNFRAPRVVAGSVHGSMTPDWENQVPGPHFKFTSSGWPWTEEKVFLLESPPPNLAAAEIDSWAQEVLDDAIAHSLSCEYEAGPFGVWKYVYYNVGACLLLTFGS
jgi:hypothetical protein